MYFFQVEEVAEALEVMEEMEEVEGMEDSEVVAIVEGGHQILTDHRMPGVVAAAEEEEEVVVVVVEMTAILLAALEISEEVDLDLVVTVEMPKKRAM